MKIIIAILILTVYVAMKKIVNSTTWQEAKLLTEIQKNLNTSNIFLKALTLNSIKSNAAELLIQGKITEKFYESVFIVPVDHAGESYWECNLDAILHYSTV